MMMATFILVYMSYQHGFSFRNDNKNVLFNLSMKRLNRTTLYRVMRTFMFSVIRNVNDKKLTNFQPVTQYSKGLNP